MNVSIIDSYFQDYCVSPTKLISNDLCEDYEANDIYVSNLCIYHKNELDAAFKNFYSKLTKHGVLTLRFNDISMISSKAIRNGIVNEPELCELIFGKNNENMYAYSRQTVVHKLLEIGFSLLSTTYEDYVTIVIRVVKND